MKTSMNLLRTTNACTGGFGRQASFWGVRPKAKAVEYPIWMVGLIGTYDDMSWAINNSLVVDEAEFAALKARTFWPMFQSIFWTHVRADMILKQSTKKSGDFIRDALQEGLAVRDSESAQAWIAKYQRFKVSHDLFQHVVNHEVWTDAQKYLAHMMECIENTKPELLKEHEQNPFNLDSNIPGHDSRTMKPIKSTVRRGPAVRRRDVDEEDDEEPRYKAKTAEVQAGDVYYFDVPKTATGRVITKAERFAHIMLNEDPWPVALQFLLDNNVPKIIGSKVNLSKVSPDGVKPPQFAASLHLSDPRIIFMLIHIMQGHDFDLLKILGVEPQAQTLKRVLLNYGAGDTMDDFDQVIDSPENFSDTQRRVVREMQSARDTVAENGPSNMAFREREIRSESNSDESWDAEPATADEDDEA